MNKTLCGIMLLCGISLLPEVMSAPAYWYKWQSIKTAKTICKQTEPGPGWLRHSGPYLDGGCRTLRKPPSVQP